MNLSLRPRIGDLLVSRGLLSAPQVRVILAHQKSSGRPFGELAERLCGVEPRAVETAWAQQYLAYATHVDLDAERVEPEALAAVTRRQARQFQVLPLRRRGGQLLVATTAKSLGRAARFGWSRLGEPMFLLIAGEPELLVALDRYYPWTRQTVAPSPGPAREAGGR